MGPSLGSWNMRPRESATDSGRDSRAGDKEKREPREAGKVGLTKAFVDRGKWFGFCPEYEGQPLRSCKLTGDII